MKQDEFFMKEAIRLSREAARHGNEPFGAVLVRDGQIVHTNENQIYSRHDFTAHAELGLIQAFCAETGVTDLHEYTLYSSCEPCFMCSGAMVWARLGRLVSRLQAIWSCVASSPPEAAHAAESYLSIPITVPQVTPGVLRAESLEVLREYFSAMGSTDRSIHRTQKSSGLRTAQSRSFFAFMRPLAGKGAFCLSPPVRVRRGRTPSSGSAELPPSAPRRWPGLQTHSG